MRFTHSALVLFVTLSSNVFATPTSNMISTTLSLSTSNAPYWLEQIAHQGYAPYSTEPTSFQVFRNVKDFGAQGDGFTDDTQAIQQAMDLGDRCQPGKCNSTTMTPVVLYFPAGTYLLSSSIIDNYYTQIIGNPNSLPVLKAAANFSGSGLIDSNPDPGFTPQNIFFRQVRNFVFDLTSVPANTSAVALRWTTSQATSLQNCVFEMSSAPGAQHTGLLIDSGSGGFMTDLTFNGGFVGAIFGNQQFTARNMTFNNAVTAISQIWDWGWTYSEITINNCNIGLNMSNLNDTKTGQAVGSVTFIDSTILNTKIAFLTNYNSTSQPDVAGSLIIDNVYLENVEVAVQDYSGTVLPGGTMHIDGWGEGHKYTPNGPQDFEGQFTPFSRPQSLLVDGKFYTRSKPQYEDCPVSDFMSVRSAGAKGDGETDDTAILQQVMEQAAANNKIVFFDYGLYKVTSTLYIPPGSKIVGESYAVILGTGSCFSSITEPVPVVQVGKESECGIVEWSDMIVSTKGSAPGALLIKWNLMSEACPSGMWDVHTRIGGFAGSDLQLADCPTNSSSATTINNNCIAGFMSMHFTENANNLYMENVWLWVADHDIEDPDDTQITIFMGRGFLSESKEGNIWMWGTAVEHHALYEYQFVNTKNVFMGQIQTETAYYQPDPDALKPFPALEKWHDPAFAESCKVVGGNCADGWGLRIVDSEDILVYGAGLYSFFDNYNTTCSNATPNEDCQVNIFSLEGAVCNVGVYNLNTIGVTNMITRDGQSLAGYADNKNVYPDTIALFTSQ